MKFNSIFALAAVCVVAVVMVLSSGPAEAKRLGGGASFGKSYNYSRTAKPASTPARDQAQSAGQQAKPGAAAGAAQQAGSRRGGFMGPLMGLAAGGMLAAMFFGGAFDGINFFDILLIGALVIGGLMLFKSFRKPAGAGNQGYRREVPAGGPDDFAQPEKAPGSVPSAADGFAVPAIGSGLQGEQLSEQPAWFNEHEFMAEVKNHFHTLHQAWESRNLEEVRGYTTPGFFSYLEEQMAREPAGGSQITGLDAQLLDLLKDGDNVVAAILFRGTEKADGFLAEDFAEIWHVEHPAESAGGNWTLAGIRQMD